MDTEPGNPVLEALTPDTIDLSWMWLSVPIRTTLLSPFTTEPYQTADPVEISTSPMTDAFVAIKAVGSITGDLECIGKTDL